LTSPEDLLILYRSGIFAINTSIVNFQTCPRHRDDLEVLVSSIPSILFCGFYELLHNKCSSYVDAHEFIEEK
jgi:hypothetical protein